MKIKLVSILFFIGFSMPAFAQWGVKGGVNYSNIARLPDVSYRLGGYIGVTYDKPLSSKWYFQPGLLFTSYGTNIKSVSASYLAGMANAEKGIRASHQMFRLSIGYQF